MRSKRVSIRRPLAALGLVLILLAGGGCGASQSGGQAASVQQAWLDHLAGKYGGHFSLEGASVTADDHPEWPLFLTPASGGEGYQDNYAPRLLREELESVLAPLAQEALGDCQLYLEPNCPPSALGPESTAEELLTQSQTDYTLFTPASGQEEDEARVQAFLDGIRAQGYQLRYVRVLFMDPSPYVPVERPEGSYCQGEEIDQCQYWLQASLEDGGYDLVWREPSQLLGL